MRIGIFSWAVIIAASTCWAGETEMQTTVNEVKVLLESTAQRVNDEEMKERREYYDQQEPEGRRVESFEEHIRKYADLAKLGTPASDQDIDALRELSAVPLPPALVEFYQSTGSFTSGYRLNDLKIHAPEKMVAKSRMDSNQNVKSIGLVDMIVASWGGDRPEFQPQTGEGLMQEEADTLNAGYSIFGWRSVLEGEGFEYLYFDAEGSFGTLYYHQDGFGELYADKLRPMLTSSSATQSFIEVMQHIVKASSVSDFDKEDGE